MTQLQQHISKEQKSHAKKILRLIDKFHKDHREFSENLTNENWIKWANSPAFWLNYSVANLPVEDASQIALYLLNTPKTKAKYIVLRDMLLAVYTEPDHWLKPENCLCVSDAIEQWGMPE